MPSNLFFFCSFLSGQDMTTFLLAFPFIFFAICFFAKSLHKAYKKNAFFLSQGAFCCQPFFSSPPFSSHQTRSSLRLAGIQDLSPPPPPRLFQSQFLGNPGLTVTEQLSGGRGRGSGYAAAIIRGKRAASSRGCLKLEALN